MSKVVLFVMTRKGYESLAHFIRTFGSSNINFVVGAEDAGNQEDCYREIKDLCKQHQVAFYSRQEKFTVDTEYVIAISWRWMITLGDSKLIVMHDSLLPRYRGFAPLVNCLVNGEQKIGVTALYASEEYDRGDIIASDHLEISYPLKIKDAIEMITSCYKNLIEHIGKKIISGELMEAKKQREEDATYSLWLDESDYDIDWNKDAETLKRFIDAVGFPYNGAATYMDGKKLRIADAEVLPDLVIENRKPGKIIFMEQGKPVVVCGKGLIRIKSLIDDATTQEMLPLKRFRIRFT